MGSTNRYEGIDNYAVRLIKNKARQLIGLAGFTESDREDIEQEMLLDLLRRLPKFDPRRAQRSTFIARIIEHKIATLIEAQEAAVRDYRKRAFSLNEEMKDGDGATVERGDTFDQDCYLRRTDQVSNSTCLAHDLSIDLRVFLAALPPELRTLCEQLAGESVADLVRRTGTPRSTIYESIKKLRRLLEDAGLDEYLRSAPTLSRSRR
jgi:RNA polymerase sigma-70 factor (ECF subfamily)